MINEDIVRLARIEAKIDTLIEAKGDHEARLRQVEQGQWKHTGGLLVLTPLSVWFLSKLGLH